MSLDSHDYNSTAPERKDTISKTHFITEGQFSKVYLSNEHHRKMTEFEGAFVAGKPACTITNFYIMMILLIGFTTKGLQTFLKGWNTFSSKEITGQILSHSQRVNVLAAFLGNTFCWLHRGSKGLAVWGGPCWHSVAAHAKKLKKVLMSGVQKGCDETELANSRNATYSLYDGSGASKSLFKWKWMGDFYNV